MRLIKLISITTLVFALNIGVGLAETYPIRPIRLIIPLGAGSAGDALARLLSSELGKTLGQPIIVDNKVGAGGTIAMSEIARSSPDGYTLGFSFSGSMVFNMALFKKPGYDPKLDFSPIALVGGLTNVLVVPESSPYKTLAELLSAIKSKPPNTFTYSSSGTGTSHHIAGVLFESLTNTKILHIPYKTAPQGVIALLGNEVDMGFYNLPVVINQIRNQKLRALAVTTLQKSAQLSMVPTLSESGVKGYELFTWLGFVAPAKTSPAIINRINSELSKIISTPAIREKMVAQGYDVPLTPLLSPEQFARLIQDDLAKWPPIIRASGVEPE